MDNKQQKTELNHQKVISLLKNSAQTALDAYPEPVAIITAVVWNSELGNELPVGLLMLKSGVTNSDALTLMNRCLQQNAKMGEQVTIALNKKLVELGNMLKELKAQAEKLDAARIQTPSKEVENGKEAVTSLDPSPFAPGTK